MQLWQGKIRYFNTFCVLRRQSTGRLRHNTRQSNRGYSRTYALWIRPLTKLNPATTASCSLLHQRCGLKRGHMPANGSTMESHLSLLYGISFSAVSLKSGDLHNINLSPHKSSQYKITFIIPRKPIDVGNRSSECDGVFSLTIMVLLHTQKVYNLTSSALWTFPILSSFRSLSRRFRGVQVELWLPLTKQQSYKMDSAQERNKSHLWTSLGYPMEWSWQFGCWHTIGRYFTFLQCNCLTDVYIRNYDYVRVFSLKVKQNIDLQ